jgi:hypothetical protein
MKIRKDENAKLLIGSWGTNGDFSTFQPAAFVFVSSESKRLNKRDERSRLTNGFPEQELATRGGGD